MLSLQKSWLILGEHKLFLSACRDLIAIVYIFLIVLFIIFANKTIHIIHDNNNFEKKIILTQDKQRSFDIRMKN